MAISYRATGVYNSSGSTTAVVAAPTGLVNGDLIFVIIRRAAAVAPTSTPSGWTLIRSVLSTYGCWIYYKIATNEGASWTWTWAASAKTLGRAHAFYGNINTSNPIQGSTTPYSGTASGTAITIPTLTTTSDNTHSIILASTYSTSSKTFSVPTSPAFTEHNDTGSTTPDFWQAIASYAYPASGTATGTISYPASANSTYRIGCQILVNTIPPNTAPMTILNTPTDTGTIAVSTPTFNFTGTDAEADAIEYNIQVDNINTFNSGSLRSLYSATDTGFSVGHPFASGVAVNYTAQTAISPGTYYWRVCAIDPNGSNSYGAWSDIRSFTLPSNVSPAVALNTPSDTLTGLVTTPTLNFTGIDPEGENVEYEVQIDTLNTFNSVSGGAPSTLFSNSFESASWTSALVSGSGGAWTIAASSSHPTGISPQNGSSLAIFNSYTCQANVQARFYPNTTFNIPSNAGEAILTFWINHDTNYATSNDQIQPQISTNSGTDWLNVGIVSSRYSVTAGWEQITVSLENYIGASDILIGFLGISGYGNDCHIDNVVVSYTLPNTPLLDKKSLSDTGFTAGHPYSSGLATEYTVQAGESLAESLIYFWRVRAKDPSGSNVYGNWSDIRSFSVGNIPPSVNLNSPSDTELASTTPTLSFTGSDPESDKVEYKLQIDTVNTFDSQAGNPLISATSISDIGFSDGHPYDSENSVDYTVQSKLNLGTFYWRVAAIDPLGRNVYGAWSNTQSFITVSNAPPSVILNSPKANATGTLTVPILKFTGIDPENNNIEYEIQVDTTSSFDSNTGRSGNILLTNSFEAAGWTSVLVSGASAAWSIVTTSSHPTGISPNNGSRMACFNSYTCQSNAQARYYPNTTTFNIPSNAGSPNLTYWMYHETASPANNERIQLQVSLNSGTSWTSVGAATSRYDGTTGWKKVTIDLTKYIGKNSILIGLLGISGYGNDVYIDNITVEYKLPLIDESSVSSAGFSAGHPFASESITTYAIQAANTLTEGVDYYWRVRAIDPLGRNSYGFWSETRKFTPNSGIKIWNGTAWVYKPAKIWTGTSWTSKRIKVWDDADWVING